VKSILWSLADYVWQVVHRWVALVGGAVVAAVAFVVLNLAGADDVPVEVWWIVSALTLFVATFEVFRRLSGELNHREWLHTAPEIVDERFRPFDVTDPSADNLVSNRIFRRCTIVGPAVISLLGNGRLDSCQIGTVDAESHILERTSRMHGTIMFAHCEFERCHFEDITYVGDANLARQIRETLRIPD
jgi:hypothetical protein